MGQSRRPCRPLQQEVRMLFFGGLWRRCAGMNRFLRGPERLAELRRRRNGSDVPNPNDG